MYAEKTMIFTRLQMHVFVYWFVHKGNSYFTEELQQIHSFVSFVCLFEKEIKFTWPNLRVRNRSAIYAFYLMIDRHLSSGR